MSMKVKLSKSAKEINYDRNINSFLQPKHIPIQYKMVELITICEQGYFLARKHSSVIIIGLK